MTCRIRIVRVVARTNVGGPSLQITALMRGLDGSRFDQSLMRGTVEEGEADYLELQAPDVVSTVVPGLGRSVRPLDDVRALLFLIKAFRRERPVIVHTHTAKAGVLGRMAAIATRTPISVHTFHGHVLHGYFSPRVTKVVVLIERMLSRFTTHIVAVGDQVRDDLLSAGIARPDRASVVAPGVVKLEFRERVAALRALGLEDHDGRLAVMFVGRLTAIKRAERFVQLARTMRDRKAPATFVVVGDGPLRAQLETDAKDLDNLIFIGWQSDMASVYAAADLLVLTSDNEGMPVALIEAAMQGVPAVSTAVGAVRQVVDDGVSGLLVPVGDQDALAAAVHSLINDVEKRRSMGEAAAARAEALFSERRLVADYELLYEELLADVKSSRLAPRGSVGRHSRRRRGSSATERTRPH